MSLDTLWAGWRSEYVATATATGATATGPSVTAGPDPAAGEEEPPPCVFCRLAASGPPSPDTGVLWVGAVTFAVLNAYPYASGHLMVLPRRHVGALAGLTDHESTELWAGVRQGAAALEAGFGPEGLNLGANLGQAAGAGIPRHLHVHAVPRWLGDTNFMTTVAGTRVLPQTLADTWAVLHRAWPT